MGASKSKFLKTAPPHAGKRASAGDEVRVVAAVELGTTSIRMAIAQLRPSGEPRLLDSLQQAVSLGKDTFTHGSIHPDTIEACVRALRSFRKSMQEYGVADRDIIAIATSAVREADNRDAFLDRLFIATGIDVRPADEAEVNRYTYMAVRPLLEREALLQKALALVVEVGGGSTELLEFRHGQVASSHAYRLGSLRLRRTLDEHALSSARSLQVVRNQIDRTMDRVVQGMQRGTPPVLVTLGGDMRIACSHLVDDWQEKTLSRLDVASLSSLADRVMDMSVDDVVREFHLSYPDAETLGPALLVYVRLARAFKLRRVFVGRATVRDGVLLETASRGAWTEDFRQQVINSALEIGAKYQIDREHAERVALLSRRLFELLQDEHHLDPWYETILLTAALLHETGNYVSNRAHHKHSLYLILNSDIFGLGSTDLVLTALVARYHRRAVPKPTHEYYMDLSREGRVAVTKMAAILRVADCLARGAGRHHDLDIKVEPGVLAVSGVPAGQLALEQYALQQKADLFELTYGMKVVLYPKRGEHHGHP